MICTFTIWKTRDPMCSRTKTERKEMKRNETKSLMGKKEDTTESRIRNEFIANIYLPLGQKKNEKMSK